ncbi:thioredoxin fold domain-containing protein [Flavobacterium sp. IMCC34852]|uniref:Thioredoxin fold domain-containing protein n=1 Tax=Flavobacterium rivulicola TaxID=2732161 RepID=A0A7Y3VZ05_9FLAO|nr:thioredoxin domain-containing protein [Flavobacterium sp. IMCC34852]NNT72243.1 thioredoxin fold domain-containing protein [Flavobacterium sp. IMCC34852]
MKSKLFLLLLLSCLFLSCQGQTAKNIQTLDPKTYAEKLKTTEKPQLLDVRTPQEYEVEHLENADNVNINSADFATKAAQYDKTKPVFVYCKVGGRSAQAADKLAEMGFKEIYNLDGGIMKWSANNLPKTSQNTQNVKTGMTSDDFQKLITSDKKVLINFTAVWCGPCQKMKPYVLKLQEELKDQIKIVRLDADENKALVEGMKIDGLPTIIVYENGKEVWRNLGYITEEELRKHL